MTKPTETQASADVAAAAIMRAAKTSKAADASAATPAQPQAKTGEAAGITKRSSAFFADPDTIVDGAAQVRIDYGDLAELEATIAQYGILNPIRVKRLPKDDERVAKGAVFEQLGGHRRLAAARNVAKKAGGWRNVPTLADGVPIILDDKNLSSKDAIIRMFVDNQHKNLNPLEEADAYRRLRDGDKEKGEPPMSINEICKAVGRARPHVTEILALLEADATVVDAIKGGEITKMQAKHIAKQAKGDAELQRKLVTTAKAAKKGDKNARKEIKKTLEANKQAKAKAAGRKLKMRALDDAELSALGSSLAARMVDLMKAANKPPEFDMAAWVGADDKLALAASYGALQALKAAAGMAIKLEF